MSSCCATGWRHPESRPISAGTDATKWRRRAGSRSRRAGSRRSVRCSRRLPPHTTPRSRGPTTGPGRREHARGRGNREPVRDHEPPDHGVGGRHEVTVDRTETGPTDVTETVDRGEVVFVDGGVQAGAPVLDEARPGPRVGGRCRVGLRVTLVHAVRDPAADDRLSQPGRQQRRQPTHHRVSVQPEPSAIAASASSSGAPVSGGGSRWSPRAVCRSRPRSARRYVSRPRVPPRSWPSARGAQSGASPGSTGDNSATYDWGYGLVPTGLLTTKAVLGWAPGNSANPPSATAGDRDDDPVWVSTLGDTTCSSTSTATPRPARSRRARATATTTSYGRWWRTRRTGSSTSTAT